MSTPIRFPVSFPKTKVGAFFALFLGIICLIFGVILLVFSIGDPRLIYYTLFGIFLLAYGIYDLTQFYSIWSSLKLEIPPKIKVFVFGVLILFIAVTLFFIATQMTYGSSYYFLASCLIVTAIFIMIGGSVDRRVPIIIGSIFGIFACTIYAISSIGVLSSYLRSRDGQFNIIITQQLINLCLTIVTFVLIIFSFIYIQKEQDTKDKFIFDLYSERTKFTINFILGFISFLSIYFSLGIMQQEKGALWILKVFSIQLILNGASPIVVTVIRMLSGVPNLSTFLGYMGFAIICFLFAFNFIRGRKIKKSRLQQSEGVETVEEVEESDEEESEIAREAGGLEGGSPKREDTGSFRSTGGCLLCLSFICFFLNSAFSYTTHPIRAIFVAAGFCFLILALIFISDSGKEIAVEENTHNRPITFVQKPTEKPPQSSPSIEFSRFKVDYRNLTKNCPYCGEVIASGISICPYCWKELD